MRSNSYYNSTHNEGTNVHNENHGLVEGSLFQGFNVTQTISQVDEEKLKTYGIDQPQINELKQILQEGGNDRTSLSSKLWKWFGGVTATIATKGLTEHLPALIDFVKHLGQ